SSRPMAIAGTASVVSIICFGAATSIARVLPGDKLGWFVRHQHQTASRAELLQSGFTKPAAESSPALPVVPRLARAAPVGESLGLARPAHRALPIVRSTTAPVVPTPVAFSARVAGASPVSEAPGSCLPLLPGRAAPRLIGGFHSPPVFAIVPVAEPRAIVVD